MRMGVLSQSEQSRLAGRNDLATICGGSATVIELKYNRSFREAQD